MAGRLAPVCLSNNQTHRPVYRIKRFSSRAKLPWYPVIELFISEVFIGKQAFACGFLLRIFGYLLTKKDLLLAGGACTPPVYCKYFTTLLKGKHSLHNKKEPFWFLTKASRVRMPSDKGSLWCSLVPLQQRDRSMNILFVLNVSLSVGEEEILKGEFPLFWLVCLLMLASIHQKTITGVLMGQSFLYGPGVP
jgi:hypothetical protein